MKTYGENGTTSHVDGDKVVIEISMEDLELALGFVSDGFDAEVIVVEGQEGEFLEWVARNLHHNFDPHVGSTLVDQMLDNLFTHLAEGHIDGDNIFVDEGAD